MIQLLAHTGRQFGLDAADQQGVGVASIMPQFFGDQAQPDVLVAVRAWTSALVAALDRQDTHVAVGDPPRPRSAGHADFRRDRRLPQPRPSAASGRPVPARGSASCRQCLTLAAVGPARDRRASNQISRVEMSCTGKTFAFLMRGAPWPGRDRPLGGGHCPFLVGHRLPGTLSWIVRGLGAPRCAIRVPQPPPPG